MQDLRARKQAEAVTLRKDAVTADTIGRAVVGLAPVLAQELAAIADVRTKTPALQAEWKAAVDAAREAAPEDAPELWAMAALRVALCAFSKAAEERVTYHGNRLQEAARIKLAEANAIAKFADELGNVQPGSADDSQP